MNASIFSDIRLLAAALAVILAASVAGCNRDSDGSAADGVVTVEFWNGFTGPDGKTMERIVREFNREHEDVRVRMQIIPWNTYYDKVTLSLAYGGAPDVFILHADRLPEYANSEAVITVDDLLAAGDLDPEDFTPTTLAVGQWDGRQYAIPLDCHPIGLYYNVDLFEKAGIVDEHGRAKPPTDLEEFLETARRLTRDTTGDGRIDQWGFAFTWLRTNAYTILVQHGGNLITEDGSRSALSDPSAEEAFRLITDMIYDHKICPAPEGQDAWIGFRTGKVAMALEGIYMLTSVEQQQGLNFAGAPAPQFGPVPGVWGGSHLLSMPSGISDERREAAWKFIKYLSDNSLEWSKGGQVPVRKSILAKPEFRELSVQYEFSRQLDYVIYPPPSIMLNQIYSFSDAAIEAILNRIKPADEALSEATRRINQVLERQ